MRRAITMTGLICVAGLAIAGCSSSQALLDKDTYSEAFTKKFFVAPEWGSGNRAGDNIHLSPKGPVGSEDLVSADGRCAPAAVPAQPAAPADAQAAAPAPAAPAAVATNGAPPPSERLEPDGGGSGGAFPAPGAPVLGGVALGMSECDVVRRAGQPTNVAIDGGGERRVTITYLEGNWPGIYHFRDGRLKEVEAAPTPPKPAKPAKVNKKSKKKPAPQKSAKHEIERVHVQ